MVRTQTVPHRLMCPQVVMRLGRLYVLEEIKAYWKESPGCALRSYALALFPVLTGYLGYFLIVTGK